MTLKHHCDAPGCQNSPVGGAVANRDWYRLNKGDQGSDVALEFCSIDCLVRYVSQEQSYVSEEQRAKQRT